MRFGIVAIPTVHEADGLFERAIGFAARVEALGFAGLWTTDAFARGSSTLDPLLFLSALCQATERIELGTCVTQVPLRHPVEQAHRAQTINLLSRGRFRFGVGSGSTKHDFDAVQIDYERRFTLLPDAKRSISVSSARYSCSRVFRNVETISSVPRSLIASAANTVASPPSATISVRIHSKSSRH